MARQRGRPASNTREEHNKKLDISQNDVLKDYLILLHNLGTSPNREVLITAANRLLYYSGSSFTVSARWAKKWL